MLFLQPSTAPRYLVSRENEKFSEAEVLWDSLNAQLDRTDRASREGSAGDQPGISNFTETMVLAEKKPIVLKSNILIKSLKSLDAVPLETEIVFSTVPSPLSPGMSRVNSNNASPKFGMSRQSSENDFAGE